VRVIDARDGTFGERSFPYHSSSAGKTIERVIATGQETFVAVFSLVQGKRVVFSVERWKMDSVAPSWEKRTTLGHSVRNDSLLLLWESSQAELDVAILGIESGNVERFFRLPLGHVVSVQPIAGDSYAVLSLRGVFVMDAASETASQVPGMDPSDFLDFGALAVDSLAGKLIVITAGNQLRPGTQLRVLDL
jgi:hypothetical protein